MWRTRRKNTSGSHCESRNTLMQISCSSQACKHRMPSRRQSSDYSCIRHILLNRLSHKRGGRLQNLRWGEQTWAIQWMAHLKKFPPGRSQTLTGCWCAAITLTSPGRLYMQIVEFSEQPPLLSTQGFMGWQIFPSPWNPSLQVHWYFSGLRTLHTAKGEQGEDAQGFWAANKEMRGRRVSKFLFSVEHLLYHSRMPKAWREWRIRNLFY